MTAMARRTIWTVLVLLFLGSALMGYRHFVYLKPMRAFVAALERIETERDARTAFGDPVDVVPRGDEGAYSRRYDECWIPEISDHVLVYSHDVFDNDLPLAIFLYVNSEGRITRRLVCGS